MTDDRNALSIVQDPESHMSVSPIGASSTSAVQQPWSNQNNNWQKMLSAVAGTLGVSTSALQQLQSGSSLSSIAQTKGVSQQSLIQSISAALTQNGSPASGSQLTQIATNIANRTPGAGGHHHHHGVGGSSSTAEQSSASTLLSTLEGGSSSMSSTDPLLSALGSGSSSSSSSDSLLSALDGNSSSSSTIDALLGSNPTGQSIDTLA
jgi:hypothetical protein